MDAMVHSEEELLKILDEQGIGYRRVTHPPVYTCAQAEVEWDEMGGASTKNLFLRERGGRFFLVMTDCHKRLDLKALARQIGAAGRLVFGSPEELLEKLGLTPGAVTALALVNDPDHQVQLVIDEDIWAGECFLCHPLVNTATLVMTRCDLLRFFDWTGHLPMVVRLPAG